MPGGAAIQRNVRLIESGQRWRSDSVERLTLLSAIPGITGVPSCSGACRIYLA